MSNICDNGEFMTICDIPGMFLSLGHLMSLNLPKICFTYMCALIVMMHMDNWANFRIESILTLLAKYIQKQS